MADKRKEAAAKLEEAFVKGPSSFNAPIPIGNTIPAPDQGVYRSYWETLAATGEQALKTLPIAQVQDEIIRQEVEEQGRREGRRKLSPEEANQLYPFMSRPFSAPVDSGVAEILAQRQLEIQELQGIIDGGSKGALASGSRLAMQFAIGVFDPINVITGMGIGGVVKMAATRAGLMSAGAVGGKLLAQEAVAGAVGNVLQEPLNAGLAANLQEDYDALSATAYTMALGAGLPIATAGVAKGLKYGSQRVKNLMRSAPKAEILAQQSAINQMANGKAVTSSEVIKDVMAERANPPRLPPGAPDRPQSIPYEFQAIRQPRDYNGRSFYVGADMANYDLASTRGPTIERNYGAGIYMTDSPYVANGYAASKYGHGAGGIFEVQLTKGNPNVIDLNKGLPEKARTVLEAMWEKWRPSELVRPVSTESGKLKDTTPGAKSDLPEMKGRTGQEILDDIADMIDDGRLLPTVFDQLADSLAAVGFDGYRFDGNPGDSPHNVVMLFDPKKTGLADGKIQDVGAMIPNKTMLPQHTIESLQRRVDELKSIKSDALYDEPAHQNMAQMMVEPPKEMDIPMVEESHNFVKEEIAAREGLLRKELDLELKAVDEDLSLSEQEDQITKAALHCLGRSS